jgi:hypothetical protein
MGRARRAGVSGAIDSSWRAGWRGWVGTPEVLSRRNPWLQARREHHVRGIGIRAAEIAAGRPDQEIRQTVAIEVARSAEP